MREEESGGGGGGEKKIMQNISSGRSDASFMLITLTQADQSGLIHHRCKTVSSSYLEKMRLQPPKTEYELKKDTLIVGGLDIKLSSSDCIQNITHISSDGGWGVEGG